MKQSQLKKVCVGERYTTPVCMRMYLHSRAVKKKGIGIIIIYFFVLNTTPVGLCMKGT